MKNRLTKFFTVFLAVVLCIGMAPATGSTAYAASRWGGSSISSWWNSWFGGSNKSDAPTKEEEEQPTDPDAGGKLNLSKSISKNDDGTYTINLEAYATGKVDVSTTESYKPTDIVLVLDQSASMLDSFGTLSEAIYVNYKGKTNEELYEYKDNLYVLENGQYIKVKVNREWISSGFFGGYYKYTYSYNGKSTTSDRNSSVGPNWSFYAYKKELTREEALEAAVTQFVNQIQSTATQHNVDYRVAIVGYGSFSDDNYKNTEILTTQNVVNYRNATTDDYKNALVSVNDNGNLNSRISNAIDRIIVESDTATSADLGMDMAQKVLANNTLKNQDRNKVVVMFTDGEPNHGSGFDTTVANTTIGTSKTIKSTYNANVFTVGILQNANPDDTSSNINKYMNYVSSNYPNASSLRNPREGSNQGYYMNAQNATQLNSIFKKISSSIETPSTSVNLNGESVLKDVISDNFTLPDNVKTSDIKVYTAPFAGKTGDKYNWGEKQPFNATVSIDGNTVNVSGFDYSSNYAVTTSNGNRGNKLIVQIPVNIVRTFGGNKIPSNENTSGIYDKGSMVQAFEVPTVDAPIDYEIAGTTQTIPDGTSVTKESLFEYVKDASNFEYKPDGLKNKFVNLTYTIKDGNDIVGIYTVKAGEATGSWSKENESILKDLHFDKEYSIECKITPITGGTVTEATKTATSYVYIEGVTRAFVIDFDKPVTYTKDKVFTENQISTPEKINAISYKEGTNTYGNLTFNTSDKSITYRLNKFMDGIDRYTFNVANNCTQKVNMIPATSVYYDDSFGSTDVNNGGIVYSSDWEAITNKQANKELQDAAQGLDANYGYDSSYDNFIGNSNGTVHKVTAEGTKTTATIKFTGTGIDVYALTNQTGGKVYAQLYDSNGNRKKTLAREYSYLTGELFHVPVISFNGLTKDTYTLKITVAQGSTFYLDGLRIYNPLGTVVDQLPAEAKKAYKADGELDSKLAYIRDGILGTSSIITDVQGTVYIDDYSASGKVVAGHNATLGSSEVLKEYTRYGCKTETYLPAGKSLTLTLDKDYSNLQLGLKSSDEKNVATYTINKGDEKTIKSSTDMYYKVTSEGKKITITNTSKAMIEITALKVIE